VRSVVGLFCAVVAGVAFGLLLTFATLEGEVGFYRIRGGAWDGSPRAGGVNADPYTRAALVRSGELPVGGGEGATFTARTDDDGNALDTRCAYRVAGGMPQARYWTLTAVNGDGRLMRTVTGRLGLTSQEVERTPQGGVDIVVARRVRAGDWLPVEGAGPFRLILRLYDTPLATTAAATPVFPAIRREGCA
jgi:hypothetical protein